MPVNLIHAGTQEGINTTLNGAITADATSVVLTSVTGLQYPGVVTIDRQDASGTDTPTKREYVYYTGITSQTLTGCERGLGGSTGQAHNDGAVVEECMTASLHWEGMRTCVAAALTDAGDGVHISTASVAGQVNTRTLVSVSVASLSRVYSDAINVKGQFVWTSMGVLVTSIATQATDTHLSTLRARKNLTINSCYMAVNSAPSLGIFLANIDYRSTPTTAYISLFSISPMIDVGIFTNESSVSLAQLALTSLASGTLLTPSIKAPRECGDLLLTLSCVERP